MLTFPNTGSGRPYINLDARTGLWKISQPDGPQMVDMAGKTIGLDVANAVQGWLLVAPSGADWQPIDGGVWGSAPSKDHKPGVTLTAVLDGGDVREMRGNSKAMTQFIAAVSREATLAGVSADGPIPLVRIESAKLVKIGQGTSVDIRFKMAPVAKWIARSVLDAEPEAAPAPKSSAKSAPAEDLEF